MTLIHGEHARICVTDMNRRLRFRRTLRATFLNRACLFWINGKSVLTTDRSGVRGIGSLSQALHMRRRKETRHDKQTTRTG